MLEGDSFEIENFLYEKGQWYKDGEILDDRGSNLVVNVSSSKHSGLYSFVSAVTMDEYQANVIVVCEYLWCLYYF